LSGTQGWKPLLGFINHADGNFLVSRLFHHLMVQDEAVAILHHTDPQASSTGMPAGLAFADPFGMWLED